MIAENAPDRKNSALLEVGCEELPGSLLPQVIDQFRLLSLSGLSGARISHEGVFAGGTPSRLVLRIDGLSTATESEETVVTGPPLSAAGRWPSDPSPAALGFARSQGVSPEALTVVDLAKGSYLAVRKTAESRPVFEVLPGLFSSLLSGLTFPKSMRWGRGSGPFLRPVLWILALYRDEVVGFEFGGQVSGRLTFSPRFLGGEPVLLRNVSQYEREVRSWDVELDLSRRRDRVENDLRLSMKLEQGSESWPQDLTLTIDPELLDEVACLVEGYRVVPAILPEKYRTLPPAVIRTVLKVHQRFFVAEGKDGGAVTHFLGISGNPKGDLGTVREGYLRVVAARLEDAAYYIQLDRKRTLLDRVGELDGIVFFPGVGSLGDKVRATRRVALECLALLPDPLLDGEKMNRERLSVILERAATLYKSDLLTGLVKEFPELEGEVGGTYLRWECASGTPFGTGDETDPGMCLAIARAIASHYQPRTFRDPVPEDLPSALLSLSDRATGQAGAFLGGATPTGSIDPFALRRSSLGMIRLLVEHGWPIRLSRLADLAIEGWNVSGKVDLEKVRTLLLEFWEDRLLSFLSREGDVLWGRAARLGDEPPVISARRSEFLRSFAGSPDFSAFETVKTRIERILPEMGIPVTPDPSKFAQPEEKHLWALLSPVLALPFPDLPEPGDFGREVRLLGPVIPAVHTFFDAVLVNDPDPGVRSNRLALLGTLSGRLALFGGLDLLASAAKKERLEE